MRSREHVADDVQMSEARIRENRRDEHASFHPQKKFRLNPELTFRLELACALWRENEKTIVEDALEEYLETHLAQGDRRKIDAFSRPLARDWMRACESRGVVGRHREIRRELRQRLEKLRGRR